MYSRHRYGLCPVGSGGKVSLPILLAVTWKAEMSGVRFAQSWISCGKSLASLLPGVGWFVSPGTICLFRMPLRNSGLSWTPERQRAFCLCERSLSDPLDLDIMRPFPLPAQLSLYGFWWSLLLRDHMPCPLLSDSWDEVLFLPWLSRKCLTSRLCSRPKEIEGSVACEW